MQTWIKATLILACAATARADEPSAAAAPQLTDAEQKFVNLLAESELTGSFNVAGLPADAREESYHIRSVRKTEGDNWIVTATMTFKETSVPIPVPVQVKWAGDTPMIQVTDLSIPLLGSGFTARVLFYGDRYAGTWQHGKIGGHMWGRVTHPKEESAPDKP